MLQKCIEYVNNERQRFSAFCSQTIFLFFLIFSLASPALRFLVHNLGDPSSMVDHGAHLEPTHQCLSTVRRCLLYVLYGEHGEKLNLRCVCDGPNPPIRMNCASRLRVSVFRKSRCFYSFFPIPVFGHAFVLLCTPTLLFTHFMCSLFPLVHDCSPRSAARRISVEGCLLFSHRKVHVHGPSTFSCFVASFFICGKTSQRVRHDETGA